MERKNNKNNIKNFPTNKKSTKKIDTNNKKKSVSNIQTRRTNDKYANDIIEERNIRNIRDAKNSNLRNTRTTRNVQTRNVQTRNVQTRNVQTRNGTAERTPNARKKKKRNHIIISKIFTTIIFFLIISYFGVSVYKALSRKPITYETINYGTIDNQKIAKGVIIRDETVYKAGRDGALEFYKSENERVKKGEYIASIKDQAVIQNTEQELEEINKKILEIQENREELSLFSEDAKKVDAQIQTILENDIYELAKNDMSSIYEIKGNVQKKLDIRNQMLLSETGGSISELANKKSEKEQTINANTEKITINESGILSYYVDGLEEVFSFENLDSITSEQTKMQAEKSDELLNYKLQTLEGEPVFKIVESNEFYIASYVKTDYINNWQEGDFKNIYINDEGQYKPQEVKIEKIILEDKESYILMKSTKNIIDFIDKRSISFEINKPKEGFKINNTAIAEKNFLKVPLNCIIDNIVTKKTEDVIIKIFLEDFEINEIEQVAYIPVQYGDLNVGDTITDPISNSEIILKDIFTIKGVYVVNSGIYEFKKINLDNSVSNEDFTILDPTINTSIRIYDRFIPDAKAILKEETIYN